MQALQQIPFFSNNISCLQEYRKGRRKLCSSVTERIEKGLQSITNTQLTIPQKSGELARFGDGQQTMALRNLLVHTTVNNTTDTQLRLDLGSAFTTFEGVLRLFGYPDNKISEISKEINEEDYQHLIDSLSESQLVQILTEHPHRLNLNYGFKGIKLKEVPYTKWYTGLTTVQGTRNGGEYQVSTSDPELVQLFKSINFKEPLKWADYLRIWKSFHGIHDIPLPMKSFLYLMSKFQRTMIGNSAKGALNFEPVDCRFYEGQRAQLDLYKTFCLKVPNDILPSNLQLAKELKPKKVKPHHTKPIIFVVPSEDFILVHDSTLNHSGAKTGSSWVNGGPVSIYPYSQLETLKNQNLFVSQTLASSNLSLTEPTKYNPSRLLFEALRLWFLNGTNDVTISFNKEFDPSANKAVDQATISFTLSQSQTINEVAA